MRVFFIIIIFLLSMCLFAENIFIEMKVGETKELKIEGLSQLGGANSKIVKIDMQKNKLNLKAVNEGYSQIYVRAGKKELYYTIFVENPKSKNIQNFEEFENILKNIEGIKYKINKNKISVTGEHYRLIDYIELITLYKYLLFFENMNVILLPELIKGVCLEFERSFSEAGFKDIQITNVENVIFALGIVKNEKQKKIIDKYFGFFCDNEPLFTEEKHESGSIKSVYNTSKTSVQCKNLVQIESNDNKITYLKPETIEVENKKAKEKLNISKEIKSNIKSIMKDILKTMINEKYFYVKRVNNYLLLTGEISDEENYNKYIELLNKYPEVISLIRMSFEFSKDMLINFKVKLKENKIENLIVRHFMNVYIIDAEKLTEDTKKTIIEIMNSLNIFELKEINNYNSYNYLYYSFEY